MKGAEMPQKLAEYADNLVNDVEAEEAEGKSRILKTSKTAEKAVTRPDDSEYEKLVAELDDLRKGLKRLRKRTAEAIFPDERQSVMRQDVLDWIKALADREIAGLQEYLREAQQTANGTTPELEAALDRLELAEARAEAAEAKAADGVPAKTTKAKKTPASKAGKAVKSGVKNGVKSGSGGVKKAPKPDVTDDAADDADDTATEETPKKKPVAKKVVKKAPPKS